VKTGRLGATSRVRTHLLPATSLSLRFPARPQRHADRRPLASIPRDCSITNCPVRVRATCLIRACQCDCRSSAKRIRAVTTCRPTATEREPVRRVTLRENRPRLLSATSHAWSDRALPSRCDKSSWSVPTSRDVRGRAFPTQPRATRVPNAYPSPTRATRRAASISCSVSPARHATSAHAPSARQSCPSASFPPEPYPVRQFDWPSYVHRRLLSANRRDQRRATKPSLRD